MNENSIENYLISILEIQGYEYLTPEENEFERNSDFSSVLLKERIRSSLSRINPGLTLDLIDQAIRLISNLPSTELITNNEVFHTYLTEGITLNYREGNEEKSRTINLIDYSDVNNNEFVVTNQFTIIENNHHKRPDAVIFVNGLPLVTIELKNPNDQDATIDKAFTQLNNYKKAIPSLFYYNEILVISDGLDAKVGTISADISRFSSWKTSDGTKDDNQFRIPQLESLTKGMLNKSTVLDLIRHFIVFEKNKTVDLETNLTQVKVVKKVAAYHQYYAVNKAIISTKSATSSEGNRKAGIFWHTQGSGKSLSMVFYTGKLVLELDNPTIVVVTDRNDLDDQLFDTFANAKQLLRQDPIQAESRTQLKELLKTAGGGIVFTTIQKFFTDEGQSEFELLSNRKNIIVMADEAHRSQYGFAAKTTIKDGLMKVDYGFAKYLRDALPNASFIGFTGTPIEKADASTPAVFGNYIDVYDIAKAVEDKATVPIFYESRLVKVHLKPEQAATLDEELAEITESEENTVTEKAKAKWTQFEAIVGHKERLASIAADLVEHFENRQSIFEGKAMIVAMSRRIAVELYEAIIELRPQWHSNDKNMGNIKVVMTSSSSDPENWQMHHTNKHDRKALGERFKNPSDELKIVIVRDMWLTGFDVQCLDTMYIDKLMQGANLMQAIARVNRVYKDKQGGLIVDYIGFASELKKSLSTYTEAGGKGTPAFDINEAIATFYEKFEVVESMFKEKGFDYTEFLKAETSKKLSVILEAQEYILELENGKNRYITNTDLMSKAFSLCVQDERVAEYKEQVAFFQALKARLVKFETTGSGKSGMEIESAIRQIVDKAVISDGVIDVFEAAGISKPNISILDDQFLLEVKDMEHKNLAMELLRKILNDEIKSRVKTNVIQSKKFSEMLENAIKKYQNNLLTAVEIIEELIKIAQELRKDDEHKKSLGLNNDEIAFYDALVNNGSAMEVLGDKQLRELSRILVQRVKENATIDWNIKESVQSKLRVAVKRLLREYGYPPDLEKIATDNILKQAEFFAGDWSK